jgi:sulfur-carrier protein
MSKLETVTIKLFSLLQFKLGLRQLHYSLPEDGATVLDVLHLLQKSACERHLDVDVFYELLEEDGSIRPGTIILINGKNVLHAEGLHTRLPKGCTVSMFPPSGGG